MRAVTLLWVMSVLGCNASLDISGVALSTELAQVGLDLDEATGGEFLSISDTDWQTHLETIGAAVIPDIEGVFELTAYPVPDTIEVRVDGVEATSGWAWDSSDNTITFDPDQVPGLGSTVQADYVTWGSCD